MELIGELVDVPGGKINKLKPTVLAHPNSSMAEKEFITTIPFEVAEKNLD